MLRRYLTVAEILKIFVIIYEYIYISTQSTLYVSFICIQYHDYFSSSFYFQKEAKGAVNNYTCGIHRALGLHDLNTKYTCKC